MAKKQTIKIKESFKRILKIIRKPEMVILPGNVAYSLILSIFPSLMVLGLVISFFHISLDEILTLIPDNIPESITEIISNFLSSGSTGIALFTFLIGLFFSSNGTDAIITSANMIYKTEEKNALKKRLKSLILVVVLMFMFMFTTFILGFGTSILKAIIKFLNGDFERIYTTFAIMRWPIMALIIYFFVKVIYIVAPSLKISHKSVNKGALFTTIGWIISTFIYSLYVTNFADYSMFYGSLASIIILMIWIYILSLILVIGFGINAEEYLSNEEAKK